MNKIYTKFLRLVKRPNPNAVLIFGNQKSGTSAIANLLADYAGCSKTIDIPGLWPPVGRQIITGEKLFRDCFPALNLEFSRKVVKEPMLTFFTGQVLDYFPEAKGVFIVRDPRDNIRSLLNRRKLPGNLSSIEGLEMAKGKTFVGDPELWGGISATNNYVDQLALRWNAAYEQYKDNSERLILVRYEDFVQDKKVFIRQLADELMLTEKASIESKMDVQYQPKGNNEQSWEQFFGKDNLLRINKHCLTHCNELGYRSH